MQSFCTVFFSGTQKLLVITISSHKPSGTQSLPGILDCYTQTCSYTFKLQSRWFYDLPLFSFSLPFFFSPLLILCFCIIGYTTFKHTVISLQVLGVEGGMWGNTNGKTALSVVARIIVLVENTFFNQHLKIIFWYFKSYYIDGVQEGGGYVQV